VNRYRAEYKRPCHLNNVYVSSSKYNSTFTHELCILCGRHYLCGDAVPLRSLVPTKGQKGNFSHAQPKDCQH